MERDDSAWENLERRICEQAGDYYALLVGRGEDPEAARIQSDELVREMRESLEQMSAVQNAQVLVLSAARIYGILCRDVPLDNGSDALQERQQARSALLRAAVELVRIEETQIEEE